MDFKPLTSYSEFQFKHAIKQWIGKMYEQVLKWNKMLSKGLLHGRGFSYWNAKMLENITIIFHHVIFLGILHLSKKKPPKTYGAPIKIKHITGERSWRRAPWEEE